jgi:hypothetical protein
MVRHGQQDVAMVMANSQIKKGEVAGPTGLIAVRNGGEYAIRELRLAEAGVVLYYKAPKSEPQNLAQASQQLILRVPISRTGR